MREYVTLYKIHETHDHVKYKLPVEYREEIVRCRDCKHYTEDDMEYYHYCGNWCEQVEPDGFCAWGERKSE